MANKNKKKVVLGVGVAAAAAVALAGAYFLYGKDGVKNRKKVKGWMLKAKGEVLEKLEQLERVTPKVYEDVVAGVMSRYKKLKSVDAKDLANLSRELKASWKHVSGEKKESAVKKPRRASRRRA
ncbi:MAG: hypothetical protein AAB495_04120 [Patescibacteria group bacterium]